MPEIVLKSDGRCFRRPFAVQADGETEIDIESAILSTLTLQVRREVKNVATLANGAAISACIVDERGTAYLTTELRTLSLLCAVKIAPDKTVRPSWSDAGDSVRLEWMAPANCRLFFAARLSLITSLWIANPIYIFANKAGTLDFYHLPIANLYSDCRICTGKGDSFHRGATMMESFQFAFNSIYGSRWNSHLIRESTEQLEQSKHLLRFRPVADGFETIAPENPWHTYCDKVVTDVINKLVF